MPKILLGKDYKFYYDSAYEDGEVWSTPTWVACTHAEELEPDDGVAEIQIPLRGLPVEVYEVGKDDWSWGLTIQDSTTDPFVLALKAARAAKLTLRVALAEGVIATAGTKYAAADMTLTSYSRSTDQGDGGKLAVTLRCAASSANTPGRFTAA